MVSATTTRFDINDLASDATIGDLRARIMKETNLTKPMFMIYYKRMKLLEERDAEPLLQLGFVPGKRVVVDLCPPLAVQHDIDTASSSRNVNTSASTERHSESVHVEHCADDEFEGLASLSVVRAMDNSDDRITAITDGALSNAKRETKFVGLCNQGATCYMNSLLQTLFMTPEFRTALYQWSFEEMCRREWQKGRSSAPEISKESNRNGSDDAEGRRFAEWAAQMEESNIPRQLQKLFVRLQLSEQDAVSTQSLTKSFGWTASDVFTQHDVQELCRVLFDALELTWKGTEQENVIRDLYQGEWQDYVRCEECHRESHRTETYYDIPLVIKPFGTSRAVHSVEEALSKFIDPELLTDDNQYYCEQCQKKVYATKSLKFLTLPYLLTLQLKRFDFDYQRPTRIKLNHRVTFPLILDMNPYIGERPRTHPQDYSVVSLCSASSSAAFLDTLSLSIVSEESVVDKDTVNLNQTGALERVVNDTTAQNHSDYDPEDRKQNDDKVEVPPETLARSPYVYELFSVLVHCGSALGGHYFAYIKNLDDGEWYEFNDRNVTRIDLHTLASAFGEEDEKEKEEKDTDPSNCTTTSFDLSGTSAYMLMYRQIDPARNQKHITAERIPPALRAAFFAEVEAKKKKLLDRERTRQTLTLFVHYGEKSEKLKLYRDITVATATAKAKELFAETRWLPAECVRLRKYGMYSQAVGSPLPTTMTLRECKLGKSWGHVLLETRSESTRPWPPLIPYGITIRLHVYLPESRTWTGPTYLPLPSNAKLCYLQSVLSTPPAYLSLPYTLPPERQCLVLEDSGSKGVVLEGDARELRWNLYVFDGSRVFLEPYPETFTSVGSSVSSLEPANSSVESTHPSVLVASD